MKTDRFYRHDGPIFWAHNMIGAEGVPHDYVCPLQRPILLDIGGQSIPSLLLVWIITGCIALRRIVGSYPKMRARETAPLPLWRPFMEERECVLFRHELIRNGLTSSITR